MTVSPGPAGPDELTRMELAISHALRWGVLLSAAVILAGVLMLGWRHDTGYGKVQRHHLSQLLACRAGSGAGVFPTAPGTVIQGVRAGRPYAIIALGLLLLIATPVVRVALSVLFFLSQEDWLYVGLTLAVFAILIISFTTGVG